MTIIRCLLLALAPLAWIASPAREFLQKQIEILQSRAGINAKRLAYSRAFRSCARSSEPTWPSSARR